jgi:outer membrane protein
MASLKSGWATSWATGAALVLAATQAGAQTSASSGAQATSSSAPAITPSPEASGVTLPDAVSRALGTSPKLRQAERERDAQIEKRRSAWADIGPRVKAEYTQVHFEDKQEADFGGQKLLLRDDVTKNGSVTVLQPITGAMALAKGAQLAGVQEDLKEMSWQITRGDVAFQAAETWLRAYQAERLLVVSDASVSAADRQLKDAQALERVGRMNRGDVLKLELSASEARARAAQARATRETVIAALREAIGASLAEPVAVAGGLPAVPAADPTLAEALKEASERRLEPQLARSGVEAAEFGKKLTYSQFSPGVNVFVKWDRNFGEVAGFGGGDKQTRTYGIQASWDLWNNGSSVFQVREAAQNVAKAEEGVRGVDSGIRMEVTQAVAQLKAAREGLALARTAAAQGEEAYRIETARFSTGTRSATDLVLAETSASGAKARLVAAETDLIVSWLKLEKALGREQPPLVSAP